MNLVNFCKQNRGAKIKMMKLIESKNELSVREKRKPTFTNGSTLD